MPQGYETENDRIRKRLKETLTPREKLANWWFYHKFHVLIGALALLLVFYFLLQSRGTLPADYTVGWVGFGIWTAPLRSRLRRRWPSTGRI